MPLPCFGRRIALLTTLFMLVGLCGLAPHASADDSAIAFGGNPGMLRGHPSVSMISEVVKMYVYDKQVRVDCDFTFTNQGPACSVRMGFPDVGTGSYEEREAESNKILTTFNSFRSYVDGKPVSTKFIGSNEADLNWHTKTVFFPANSTLHIRDVYTQDVGIGVASLGDDPDSNKNKAVYPDIVGYILHTGASWHSAIGRAEINVIFHCKAVTGTLKLIPASWRGVDKEDGRSLKIKSVAPNTVVWKGPCAPTVQGKTLRFVCYHLHPTKRDDILLTYHYKTVE